MVASKFDRWMEFKRTDQMRQQAALKDRKHRVDRGRRQQLLANLARRATPKIFKSDRAIGHLTCGNAKKGESPARSELDTEDSIFGDGIDRTATRPRAGQPHQPARRKSGRIVRIVDTDPIVAQVEDDGGLAIRHEPLARVGLRRRGPRHVRCWRAGVMWRPIPIPEASD